jgi:hypothetical protein
MSPNKRGRPTTMPDQLTINERIRQAGADEAQDLHRRQVIAMARLIRRAAIVRDEKAAGRERS